MIKIEKKMKRKSMTQDIHVLGAVKESVQQNTYIFSQIILFQFSHTKLFTTRISEFHTLIFLFITTVFMLVKVYNFKIIVYNPLDKHSIHIYSQKIKKYYLAMTMDTKCLKAH